MLPFGYLYRMSSTETEPNVPDEEAAETSEGKPQPAESEPVPKKNFRCDFCPLNEWCEFKGTSPPFARQIRFAEDCYVMKDPFSPAPGPHSNKTNSEYVLVLGADCALCHRSVCKAAECSIFYGKTFCLSCASNSEYIKSFPLEIQTKIKKQLAAR